MQKPTYQSLRGASGSIAGSVVRRKRFAAGRMIAVIVASASIAVAVTELFTWLRPLWPQGSLAAPSLGIKFALGLAAGIFIDRIVQFDSKKVFAEQE